MTANGLQTVGRTLALLDLFAGGERSAWTLSELARATSGNKATVFRMLGTLEQFGYLIRNAESLRYRLGPAAIALGTAAATSLPVREIGAQEMLKLTETTGETTMLHMRSGLETVCIEKVESHHAVRVTYNVGRRGPLHAASAGKTLLAFMEPDELEETLHRMKLTRYTEHTVTDLTQLRADLSAIRDRGYATSHGELDPGVWAIGAPVFNNTGCLEAGLTLVGPAYRWTGEGWLAMAEVVLSTAARISRRLGYRGRIYPAMNQLEEAR